jgi:hypothetical protein
MTFSSRERSFFALLLFVLIARSTQISTKTTTNQPCTQSPTQTGTTANFEQIFLGRCYYFINVLYGNDCSVRSQKINCPNLLAEFNKAVLKKNPCEITIDDFTPFLRSAYHPIAPNSTLFWSGASNPAHACIEYNKFIFKKSLI